MLAPIAYLGPTQVVRWRDVQRRDADKELRFATESLARAIDQALDASIRELTGTANHIGVYGSLEPDLLQIVLGQHCSAFPSCLGLFVSGPDAHPITGYPLHYHLPNLGVSERTYYQEMLRTQRTSVSGVELGKFTGVPTIHVCAPIWSSTDVDSRKFLGAVVGALGLGYLQELTTKSVEVYGDMQARVLDGRKRVAVDSNPRGQPALADFSAIKLYADVSPGQTMLRTGRNEWGESVRAAFVRVSDPRLDWTVVVMRPTWKIEEQARRAQTSTLIAVFGALVLGMMFAFVLSSWLARPISRLARYTLRVASGEGVSVPTPARWDAREVNDLVTTVGAMVAQLRDQADALREREKEQVVLARFRQELEIAARIQIGILPKNFDVPGFEIATLMRPAEAVGGDYYELLPTESGFWIAAGDVSGHGLTAGLVMLMLQSALGALAIYTPNARPAEILKATNRILVENIRRRLGGDDHVTLVLMHVMRDGSFIFAGGHEPLLIVRAASGKCEVVDAIGPWMGINESIDKHLLEGSGKLDPGDLLVFHSDGVVEAGASRREPYGLERLCAAVEGLRDQPAQVICREVLRQARAWAPGPQEDDMSIVVVRQL
jgi:serine phosphatase RsbU (regulator of sigma subunit)